ncbi:DUF4363 family protein [Clostridium sp. DL1XJH146]
MKNIIISILIFTTLVCSIIITKEIQHKKIDTYISKLNKVSILVEEAAWDNAQFQINEIQNNFNYEADYISIISSNEYVDEILSLINDLDYYSKEKDINKANFYVNSIINDLQHIQEVQFVNIKNIF